MDHQVGNTAACILPCPAPTWWLSVRKRAWLSMVMLNSCVRELRLDSSSTTRPPPSTVSMERASRLGVMASKSCGEKWRMQYYRRARV